MEYFLLAMLAAGFLYYVYNQTAFHNRLRRKGISRASQNAELIKVVLDLDDEPLDDLFKLYKEQFGENAAQYARHTYVNGKPGRFVQIGRRSAAFCSICQR